MRKLLQWSSCVLSLLAMSSCSVGGTGSYHSRLYTTGAKAKGVVAMLPVFYRAEKGSEMLPWSLPVEFTTEIGKRLRASDKLLLVKHSAPPYVVSQFYAPLTTAIPAEMGAQFLPAEFVVATELLEQKVVGESLVASVRVRVFDIRHQRVALIYQEIIDSVQPAATAFNDYQRYGWHAKNFDATPMGLMHHRLFREIVARVEGYVCANYS